MLFHRVFWSHHCIWNAISLNFLINTATVNYQCNYGPPLLEVPRYCVSNAVNWLKYVIKFHLGPPHFYYVLQWSQLEEWFLYSSTSILLFFHPICGCPKYISCTLLYPGPTWDPRYWWYRWWGWRARKAGATRSAGECLEDKSADFSAKYFLHQKHQRGGLITLCTN